MRKAVKLIKGMKGPPHGWLTPVILVIWEVEIGKISV
jgi:hypothetical protein